MIVNLTRAELYGGAQIGIYRRLKSVNCTEKYPDYDKNAWTRDIEGACAEIAVAKALGCYFPMSEGGFGESDLMFNDIGIQVRLNKNKTPLWVYESDNDHDVLVGVVGYMGSYEIMGYMWVADCKKREWWKEPPEVKRARYRLPLEEMLPINQMTSNSY